MKIVIFFLLLCSLSFSFTSSIFAHSGRTNSAGCHNCNVGSCAGTYHCHNGGYVPPQIPFYSSPPTSTPTPIPLELNFKTNYFLDENSCTYNIDFEWEGAYNYNQFSVSAVKSEVNECIDPGPRVDTSENHFIFTSKQSGRYMLNVKPRNAYGWNNYYYCTSIELPPIRPNIKAELIKEGDAKFIKYETTCSNYLKVDNGVGILYSKQGKIRVKPSDTETYKLSSKSRDDVEFELQIDVGDSTPTPKPTIFKNVDSTNLSSKNILNKIFDFIIFQIFGNAADIPN